MLERSGEDELTDHGEPNAVHHDIAQGGVEGEGYKQPYVDDT